MTSMNVVGTTGTLVTAFVITEAGWRTRLFIPGKHLKKNIYQGPNFRFLSTCLK